MDFGILDFVLLLSIFEHFETVEKYMRFELVLYIGLLGKSAVLSILPYSLQKQKSQNGQHSQLFK